MPAIARLADRLRHAGGTVAWVVPSPGHRHPALAEEFFGPAVARLYADTAGSGPLRERLWPEFRVDGADLLVEKSAASAFFPGSSVLPALLAARDIDTVLIAGTVTNVCCKSTARDACATGYRVIMLADANAARNDADHNATLTTIYRSFGDVRLTDEVLALLAQ